jgi:hypothetical protein
VFQLNLDSFCDLYGEWIHWMVLINSLKHSKSYIRFNLENFGLILMNMKYVIMIW